MQLLHRRLLRKLLPLRQRLQRLLLSNSVGGLNHKKEIKPKT